MPRWLIAAVGGLLLAQVAMEAPARDWAGLPVPADAGPGKRWRLQRDVSDNFNYVADADGKSERFNQKWIDRFQNPWKGPGLTEWHPKESRVNGRYLGISASRKPGTDKVYAGCITNKTPVRWPAYVEARVKLSRLVLASDVWLLSQDNTQEIDIVEAYGSDRPDQGWTAVRAHISHHVFIRKPLQDYQPTDPESWHQRDGTIWGEDWHRYGVYWRDPWHLEYYIDGQLARTVSGKEIIDPKDFTGGTGLNQEMNLIINTEDQNWRSDKGTTPTDEELADKKRNTMWVDWVRIYKPVD